MYVLLVTSRSGKRWVAPKGNLEDGLTGAESAAKEALEEAGAVGFADEGSVGRYRYWKGGSEHEVEMFPMVVQRLRRAWEEMGERERVWARVDIAAGMVEHSGLAECILGIEELVGAMEVAA